MNLENRKMDLCFGKFFSRKNSANLDLRKMDLDFKKNLSLIRKSEFLYAYTEFSTGIILSNGIKNVLLQKIGFLKSQ